MSIGEPLPPVYVLAGIEITYDPNLKWEELKFWNRDILKHGPPLLIFFDLINNFIFIIWFFKAIRELELHISVLNLVYNPDISAKADILGYIPRSKYSLISTNIKTSFPKETRNPTYQPTYLNPNCIIKERIRIRLLSSLITFMNESSKGNNSNATVTSKNTGHLVWFCFYVLKAWAFGWCLSWRLWETPVNS